MKSTSYSSIVSNVVADVDGVRWLKFNDLYVVTTDSMTLRNAARARKRYVDEENLKEYGQLNLPEKFFHENPKTKYINEVGTKMFVEGVNASMYETIVAESIKRLDHLKKKREWIEFLDFCQKTAKEEAKYDYYQYQRLLERKENER
ncbi:hypothetical protein HT594_00032 [Phenacoccus solenopsis nudivirus]|nr:hypothetical protein HT594_00032 [Phenacoccus solenopsis nudivirus]